jgi:hypothetical protein
MRGATSGRLFFTDTNQGGGKEKTKASVINNKFVYILIPKINYEKN